MADKIKPFDDESESNYEVSGEVETEARARAAAASEDFCARGRGGNEEGALGATARSGVEPDQDPYGLPPAARERGRWRTVDVVFRSLRQGIESPREEVRQQATFAKLKSRDANLAGVLDVRDLFRILRGGSEQFAAKDACYFALIREHREHGSVETLALLVRGMLPRLKGIALRFCKRRPPEKYEDICSQVLAAFSEAVKRFPPAKADKIDVNLAWRTMKVLYRGAPRRVKDSISHLELVEHLRWVVREIDRCAGYGRIDPFDALQEDQEPAAPYTDVERDDAVEMLRRLPLKPPLTDLECRLLASVDGCDRSSRDTASELGISEENARVKRMRLLKRLKKELEESGIGSVREFVTKFGAIPGSKDEGSLE